MQVNEIKDMVIEELRTYKNHLVGEIKKLKKQTREIDKQIKKLLEAQDE